MMLLYLECRGRGMALDLPATCNDAARVIRNLTAGFEDELVPIVISGVGALFLTSIRISSTPI